MSSTISALVKNAFACFKPPPKLTLSQWAEEYGQLSAESSAEPGKWRNLPYQVGIMDAITDPTVERVTMQKSARIGYTKIIGHCIGYHIHYDPCPIMVVQPTEADAEGYSKEEIAPMIRDTPVLRDLVCDAKTRDSNNTILSKNFPGGTLSLVGANSPRGFRRVSRRIVIFDEVDGYPPSAGPEGDQIKLGIKRTDYYWNRKIIAGSTPTTEALSRIAPMFEESDKRYFHVPCPHCKKFQVLKFANMKWPENEPEKAYFSCIHCQNSIEHKDKRRMIEKGKWIAEKPFKGHAGFHIWAAYSYSPNSTWGHLAREFLEAKKSGQESLKTYINTALGETWQEKSEAPEWQKIYHRREAYLLNTVPSGGVFLTAGVDVQKDRIEVEITAWGRGKESWSMDYRVLPGKTEDLNAAPWVALDNLLDEQFPTASGTLIPIKVLCIDTGYLTQHVYTWARKHPISRVFPVKGRAELPAMVGQPTAVDVTMGGKKIRRGIKLWPVGVSVIKTEIYTWLKLEKPTDPLEPYPAGFMHFPEYAEDYFLMLTAEELRVRISKGVKRYEWEKIRDRNEALDCRAYSRAAASIVGIDRFTEIHWNHLDPGGTSRPKPSPNPPPQRARHAPASAQKSPARQKSSFWNR